MAHAKRHYLPGHVWHTPDKSFLEPIKERLGIRAKGRKIYESDEEYQIGERQTVYGDWPDLEYENGFACKLVN